MNDKTASDSDKPAGRPLLPKPSGIKPPSKQSALPKITRICDTHEKKAELPQEATPKKVEMNRKISLISIIFE
ncbi:CLUMA_CG001922, isoform A [Clunio marinus]|uniref:CLUMA_CG001922, isoform A n=1 Tax=Clunio marinus TaxID=568069 RepID=A0A1J1HPJ6_9DIPT|nr:CLUMA_CG001922, isoform A [Clunio marinus]